MNETDVRHARRQVAWLMVPVGVIAILMAVLVALAASAVVNPGT